MYESLLQWSLSFIEMCGKRDGGPEVRQKVVLLSELWKAIIYTTMMSKQVTSHHVRMQFTMYRVN